MYEDFTYIADENFLANYWLEEKVVCQHCQGEGKLCVNQEKKKLSVCDICQGTGMIQRKQLNTSFQ